MTHDEYKDTELRFGVLRDGNVERFSANDEDFSDRLTDERWSLKDTVNECKVETSFLGYLHYPDFWFHTVIHRHHRARTVYRQYQTLEQAIKGHDEVIIEVRQNKHLVDRLELKSRAFNQRKLKGF